MPVANNAVSSVQQTPFGAKYLIDGQISGPTGTATAYPLRGTQK
jgi:hypothetical protein